MLRRDSVTFFVTYCRVSLLKPSVHHSPRRSRHSFTVAHRLKPSWRYQTLVMSNDQDARRNPASWSNSQHSMPNGSSPAISIDPESGRMQRNNPNYIQQNQGPSSAPPTNAARLPDRPQIPTRSSTTGTSDPDRNARDLIPHARSEDLNHASATSSNPDSFAASSPRPSPAFLQSASGSRPSTPEGSSRHNHPSSSGHSEELNKRLSVASFSSARSQSSTSSGGPKAPPTSSTSTSLSSA